MYSNQSENKDVGGGGVRWVGTFTVYQVLDHVNFPRMPSLSDWFKTLCICIVIGAFCSIQKWTISSGTRLKISYLGQYPFKFFCLIIYQIICYNLSSVDHSLMIITITDNKLYIIVKYFIAQVLKMKNLKTSFLSPAISWPVNRPFEKMAPKFEWQYVICIPGLVLMFPDKGIFTWMRGLGCIIIVSQIYVPFMQADW